MSLPSYEVMAGAFAAEGVKVHFTLLGNANMYWADALARKFGVRNIHARHEHCAIGMASGYARATGEVGVASVTDGPGFTQIATELTVAARSRLPLVGLAGDTPIRVSVGMIIYLLICAES
jgi:thiamine pyrophosphate-dependent acetolactate synthase large subunit-like protein